MCWVLDASVVCKRPVCALPSLLITLLLLISGELSPITGGEENGGGVCLEPCDGLKAGVGDNNAWFWCRVVSCGVVWCGVVWYGVVWCGVVWCGVV